MFPLKGQTWRCNDEDSEFFGQRCTVVHASIDPDFNGMGDIEVQYEDGTNFEGKVFRFIGSHTKDLEV